MVSPELLRRYPFFSGFNHEQIKALALASEELAVEQGHAFFDEGADLSMFYLVLEGSVAISLSMPDKGSQAVVHTPATQGREAVVSVARAGDVFAWSALVPPYKATSNARAAEPCRVVAIDCSSLRPIFESDLAFGYQILIKVAQIARDRIQDLHYETLAGAVE